MEKLCKKYEFCKLRKIKEFFIHIINLIEHSRIFWFFFLFIYLINLISIKYLQNRLHTYLNYPLVQRCKEIAILIDELSTTELQHIFPILIDSLFGITDHCGWGLHLISLKRFPQEFDALCHFLSPQGPVFSMCYKLLPDCYLKYNFQITFLPVSNN